jgi:hypothetical protein
MFANFKLVFPVMALVFRFDEFSEVVRYMDIRLKCPAKIEIINPSYKLGILSDITR